MRIVWTPKHIVYADSWTQGQISPAELRMIADRHFRTEWEPNRIAPGAKLRTTGRTRGGSYIMTTHIASSRADNDCTWIEVLLTPEQMEPMASPPEPPSP